MPEPLLLPAIVDEDNTNNSTTKNKKLEVERETVGRCRSQATTRRVTPTATLVTAAEKHLPNGDLYTGSFSDNLPHGSGKYLWADGCMYEGEWKRGKASVMEVEFSARTWKSNFQHGHGRYVWNNGNEYIGEWRNGVIDGRGVLIWANGNRFDGQWENGVPSGHGVFTWPDGSCYISTERDIFVCTCFPH